MDYLKLLNEYTKKEALLLQDREVVQGVCGGHCGTCSPDVSFGLQLDVRH